MKIFLFQLPLPVATVAAIFQGGPVDVGFAPPWVATFLLGVWVAITYLDRIGKLPLAGSPKNGALDSRRLKELHGTLLHRQPDGVERIIHHGQILEELAENSRDHNRTVSMLADNLRAMHQRLAALERQGGRD